MNKRVTEPELRAFFDGVGSRMGQEAPGLGRDAWRSLLDKVEMEQFFGDIYSRIRLDAANLTQGPLNQEGLEQFFAAIENRATLGEARQRRTNKRLATGFNVFDLIEPDENKLSDVLAILLDPTGEHGQGDLFLRLLLKQVGLRADPEHTGRATVRREAPTHGIQKYRRRMDVQVEGGMLLAIENKVDSAEQQDQVKDYLEHLRRCTAGRPVEWGLIYLTPEGRLPKSLAADVLEQQTADGRLHCWSYPGQLRNWLEHCRRECVARKIQDFLLDFMNYIDSTLKRESEFSTKEEDNEE